MMTLKRLSVLAVTALLVTGISGVSAVFGDSLTPVNYISANFAPITTTVSYNYDFATGALTQGTATASVFSSSNVFQSLISDPSPPDPNGFGTFLGTARPIRFDNGAVVYEQSMCGSGYPTCFSDGTFTFGNFVMYSARGLTLDQLKNLATMYYVDDGSATSNCFGGGSPRFALHMSDDKNINVYLGTPPGFADCPLHNTWFSTSNLATDSAGLPWDDSQLTCGTFYQTYSEAVACANTLGLTISAVSLVTDGGWFGTNAGPIGTGQTLLFEQIQVNGVTRFP